MGPLVLVLQPVAQAALAVEPPRGRVQDAAGGRLAVRVRGALPSDVQLEVVRAPARRAVTRLGHRAQRGGGVVRGHGARGTRVAAQLPGGDAGVVTQPRVARVHLTRAVAENVALDIVI